MGLEDRAPPVRVSCASAWPTIQPDRNSAVARASVFLITAASRRTPSPITCGMQYEKFRQRLAALGAHRAPYEVGRDGFIAGSFQAFRLVPLRRHSEAMPGALERRYRKADRPVNQKHQAGLVLRPTPPAQGPYDARTGAAVR